MNPLPLQLPKNVIHSMIPSHEFFPNNARYPLLIYKKVSALSDKSPETIEALLKQNGWEHAWVDSIYDFHHYHSNTHETLVIIAGQCDVQLGGNKGEIYTVQCDDVIILPAGIAHKKINSTPDFQCIGAYPFDVGYDMCYGKKDEYTQAVDNIVKTGLPKKDPLYGEKGLLFNYWK